MLSTADITACSTQAFLYPSHTIPTFHERNTAAVTAIANRYIGRLIEVCTKRNNGTNTQPVFSFELGPKRRKKRNGFKVGVVNNANVSTLYRGLYSDVILTKTSVIADCVASSDGLMVHIELERMWKWWCLIVRHYSSLCLE